tara:strand:- start:402 stop:1373 length:972 start_codon:yes stop_codon:yes gene_type:complete
MATKFAILLLIVFGLLAQTTNAELQIYRFDVCGAPNSHEPGWVPNGDPNVNGKMTLIIDAEQGLMTLEPSQELLDSTRYVSLHAHLYDLQKRYDNTELGQSTICWAYYNHDGRGGHCAKDDYECQTLTGVDNWPWVKYGYSVDWYRDYIKTVAEEKAAGWWFMLHSAGGHFATDEHGHLIEWDGSPYMESSFYGKNNIRPDCNARIGRRLNDRDFGTGDVCNQMLVGVEADEYFLDANGVRWLNEDGSLTEDAIAHGYDFETEYLFYNYRDNGQSDRWGGPDGGAGGFITGDFEGRCANWPPPGYGEPHQHDAVKLGQTQDGQ